MSAKLNRAERQALRKLNRLATKKAPRSNTPLNARLSVAEIEQAAKQRKEARKRNVEAFMRRGQPDPKPLDRWRMMRKAKASSQPKLEEKQLASMPVPNVIGAGIPSHTDAAILAREPEAVAS